MPPRRRWTRKAEFQRSWDPPGASWPSVPGAIRDNCSIAYSQDLMVSSNNGPQIRSKGLGTGRDLGGDFLCYKRNYEEFSPFMEPQHFSSTSNPLSEPRPHYVNSQRAVVAFVQNKHFPMPLPSDKSSMNAYATKAIARLAPTAPKADLGVFLGELREGLPRAALVRDSKKRVRRALNAGDEYLNVEFGWKPLIRDLRAFAESVQNSDEILDRYYERAGVKIRRRYDFPIEQSIVETDGGSKIPVPSMATACYGVGASGRLRTTTTSETKRWLVATFQYSVPPRNSPMGWKASMNHLFGTDLTPRTLWALAPWTWAADWVGNMGDIVDNITYLNTDTVLPHVYMMEQKTVRVEHVLQSNGTLYRSYPGEHYFRQVFETTMKQRVKGTPYGFGLNWNGFSSKQLAILAALGISRF